MFAFARCRPRLLLLVVTLFFPACSLPSAIARNAPESFSPLVKRVLPSVVNIAVTETVTGNDVLAQLPPELRDTPLGRQFRQKFRDRTEQMQGAGSGFIVDPSGIIVTNNHVVGHADKIIVSLVDGTELPAHLLGSDALTDIAVIKVDTDHPLPAVPWGDSQAVEVGDWILAAGNPFGLGGSVTAGIVSGRGRDIGSGPFDNFLQLDAPINPGNSGGPTFNMDGQVIGVNTAIVSPSGGSVGIGFAIPSNAARHIVDELRSRGSIERGWLGVSVQDTPEGQKGVVIAAIDRNGPAAKGGLRPGDLVMAVNGDAVDSANGLIRIVAATPPGTALKLSLKRGGRDFDISIVVGRRPNDHEG